MSLYEIRHHRSAANEDTEECAIDGNPVEAGHTLCALCEADERRAVALAKQLCDDFMLLPARLLAVDDAGPDADLALVATATLETHDPNDPGCACSLCRLAVQTAARKAGF